MRQAKFNQAQPATAPHGVVYANGQPIDVHVARTAAEWLTILMSGEATASDKLRWQHWRQSHPDHERAWTHIERVSAGFTGMDSSAARQSLGRRSVNRRKSLGLLMWLTTIGVVGWSTSRTQVAQQMLADVRTGVGQTSEITLADGSTLWLNSDSAVNIRFTDTERVLELVAGELFVATAKEGNVPYRPFMVTTHEGVALALGTRYSVRQASGTTMVAVQEGAVEMRTKASGQRLVLQAGQMSSMTQQTIGTASDVTDAAWSWKQGQILADNMRLEDFVHELSRYRSGFVSVDPEVADLRISGVFPVAKPEDVLASLTNSLPVSIKTVGHYWVRVGRAGG
jgi:transmembrane sensor